MTRERMSYPRRGFTLVELLVVVSIIALLIAILLPSLKKARQSAQRVACGANTRSIAQAALTYATDDPKEQAIPIGEADQIRPESYTAFYGWGGKGGAGGATDQFLMTSIWNGSQKLNAARRPLNSILYKDGLPRSYALGWKADNELDLDLYRCPADKGFTGMHIRQWRESKLSSYDHFGNSYTANCFLVGTGSGVGSPLESNSIYRRPLSRVPSPSNTLLFYENSARYASYANNNKLNGGDYDQSGCFWPYAYGSMTAKGFHGDPWHFNVSFGDGHASWLKIKGHGRVTYAGNVIPSTWQCILHRGLGYQFDTLPAGLVRTHKTRYGDIQGHTDPAPAQQDGNSGSGFDVVDK